MQEQYQASSKLNAHIALHRRFGTVIILGGLLDAAANSRGTMRRIMKREAGLGIIGGVKDFHSSAGFFLEKGEADLAAWFPRITLRRLEEVLRVASGQRTTCRMTRSEPALMASQRSMPCAIGFQPTILSVFCEIPAPIRNSVKVRPTVAM